ncbi:Transcription initiation factor TFIID subunit 8 [Pleurostoma richardsiae]|uniref:Transcription initiation factor TFIID subunit 8 n=1 Tax=Pleurostoma richardsiae TaxID=41990 RepID=A0AA38SDV1_9PEZI|nr:Transcription initiation factor TFIID subunit 8 [Pleurostoma richardsiae]
MTSDAARKRPSPAVDELTVASKRQRTEGSPKPTRPASDVQPSAAKTSQPTFNEQARMGLRRGILLALDHVGFESATEEALQSFVNMTETYLSSLATDVGFVANGARRTQPIPTDFEVTLKHFNLDIPLLKPHIRPPIPKSKLRPTFSTEQFLADGDTFDLPCLADELSGKEDKEAKDYIPQSFPDFPSIHTYKYTPTDVESVTVRSTAVADVRDGTTKTVPDWRGDPQKIREAAAREAKQAEEALRGLVRASKISNLKDLRNVAEKNPASKERYELWESAMRDLLEESGSGSAGGKGVRAAGAMGSGAARLEIADHSMIVNSQKKYHRREIPRTAKRMGDGILGKG